MLEMLAIVSTTAFMGLTVFCFMTLGRRYHRVSRFRRDLRRQIEASHYSEPELLCRYPESLYRTVNHLLTQLVIYEHVRMPSSVKLVDPLRVCIRWRPDRRCSLEVRIYLDVETDFWYVRTCIKDLVGH